MNSVIVVDEERIDNIVYRYYGRVDVLQTVLEFNPHLLSVSLLQAGDRVYLPEIALNNQYNEIPTLWD